MQVWKERTAALKRNDDDSAKLGVSGGGAVLDRTELSSNETSPNVEPALTF